MALRIRFQKAAIVIAVGALVFAGASWFVVQSESRTKYPELVEIGQSWTFDEYADFFVTLAKEKSAVYAFDVLRYARVPSSIDIHRIAHNIGYVHFEQKGLSGIYECTQEFRNACQHSIVVQALIISGHQALHDVAQVCSADTRGQSSEANCFHGVGHGLLAYSNYDYKGAIGTCRKVYELAASLHPEMVSERLWQECVGGVTMELMQGEHDKASWTAAKDIYMPPGDILMPCDANFVPDNVRPICYSYLTSRFFEAAGAIRGVVRPETFLDALSYCKKIPDDVVGSRDGCYAGFGATFAYFANGDARTLEHMPESAILKVYSWCSYADEPSGQRACELSALDVIFWGGQSDSPASILYCNLARDSESKNTCFETLISLAQGSFENQQKLSAFCSQLPSEYREECSVLSSSSHVP